MAIPHDHTLDGATLQSAYNAAPCSNRWQHLPAQSVFAFVGEM